MKIKVILKEKIKNLGIPGDIAFVAKGYARNFLVPRDKAVMATKVALLDLEAMKLQMVTVQAEKLVLAQECAALLAHTVLRAPVRADTVGRLYGAFTKQMIITRIEALHLLPILLEPKQLTITGGSIKMLGTYEIEIHLVADISVKIGMIVEALSSPSKAKA